MMFLNLETSTRHCDIQSLFSPIVILKLRFRSKTIECMGIFLFKILESIYDIQVHAIEAGVQYFF
jgi:hypothetical protein